MPSDRPSACSKLSASRLSRPGLTTTRSTTASTVCLSLRFRFGTSAISYSVPSTLARVKPLRASSASSLRYSPLRSLITGASSISRVPSGIASTRSTIWLTVCASIGRPVAGEYGTPARAQSRRI